MDRRTHPRIPLSSPVRVSVDLLGAERVAEQARSAGITRDVSRGGLSADVDGHLAVGTDCAVTLLEAEGVVRPDQVRGCVRHATRNAGGWRIGIEFDTLVEIEAPPGPLVA